eukprot:12790744-Alexandrium_andersonii.AAC.1
MSTCFPDHPVSPAEGLQVGLLLLLLGEGDRARQVWASLRRQPARASDGRHVVLTDAAVDASLHEAARHQ